MSHGRIRDAGQMGGVVGENKLGDRFFESTRGQIVALLRGSTKTVDELAKQLELTDNAVRAHLATLERDGLVRQSGTRRGLRKPHYQYSLTAEAEDLFPKAYDAVLNQLISVLKTRVPPEVLEESLREAGRSMGIASGSRAENKGMETRTEAAARALEAIGGSPKVEAADGKVVIHSSTCPFAAVAGDHPEVCELAEALVAQIVAARVDRYCDRSGPSPQCCFEITAD
jgi:predicted ArsR family transcriptional regulator